MAAVRKATSAGALAELVRGSGLLTQSGSGSAATFGSLPRLARAAAAPLLALGRGSGMTALAVGILPFRLGSAFTGWKPNLTYPKPNPKCNLP